MQDSKDFGINRRASRRYITDSIDLSILFPAIKESIYGKSKDISLYGFSGIFNHYISVEPLTPINISIKLANIEKKLDYNGHTIWDDDTQMYGVLFDQSECHAKNYILLKSYLDNLNKTDERREKERRHCFLKEAKTERIKDRRNEKPLLTKCFTNNWKEFLKKQGNWFKEFHIISNYSHLEGKEVSSFTYCNYLGIGHDSRVKQAMADAILKYGTGISAAPMLAGTMDLHKQLESKFSDFMKTEACILFPLGYSASLGAIPSLAKEGDIILSDEKSHASLIDACGLSKAKTIIYKHNNMDDLKYKLKTTQGNKLIITDGLFSMNGDIAKLDDIYDLAQKYKAVVYVDDAHAIGVLGKHGGGTVEHFGLEGKIDLVMGTFAKAFCIQGGFITGRHDIIEYLKYTSRTYLFNVSLQHYMVVGILKALESIKNGDKRRKKLQYNIDYFKSKLSNLGFDTGDSHTQIIPIWIKNNKKTKKLCNALIDNNIIVDAVFYPIVKEDESMLRIVLNSTHTKQQLDNLLDCLTKIKGL
ncbi:MAG: aminotransferase class I/II-fold pyridoxal phosphate-dependent enzyme [bacterium]|nr:aminotransferase class I/II-fold pyridoxal phosphate-dependent enzyme [bacterium]